MISYCILFIYFISSFIVNIILPVFKLNTRIILSLSNIAAYVPLWLKLKDKGVDPVWNNCRKSVYILRLYERCVGKSKVVGFQTYRNPL